MYIYSSRSIGKRTYRFIREEIDKPRSVASFSILA